FLVFLFGNLWKLPKEVFYKTYKIQEEEFETWLSGKNEYRDDNCKKIIMNFLLDYPHIIWNYMAITGKRVPYLPETIPINIFNKEIYAKSEDCYHMIYEKFSTVRFLKLIIIIDMKVEIDNLKSLLYLEPKLKFLSSWPVQVIIVISE